MFDLPTFPMTMYHPVYGAKRVDTAEEAHATFQPAHDWFESPQLADMHRTVHEANVVQHNTRNVEVQSHLENNGGTVLHCATHQFNADLERARTVENVGIDVLGSGADRERADAGSDAVYSVAKKGEKEKPADLTPIAEPATQDGQIIQAGS